MEKSTLRHNSDLKIVQNESKLKESTKQKSKAMKSTGVAMMIQTDAEPSLIDLKDTSKEDDKSNSQLQAVSSRP